jgi:energy-coupling factor transporter ATP-binding protein EcfA2
MLIDEMSYHDDRLDTKNWSPRELLDAKLKNPKFELNSLQSISLIQFCSESGRQNLGVREAKEVVFVLGNTGSGKSTFLNYIMGCTMAESMPEPVVVVSPESKRSEIIPIGHGMISKTFLPTFCTDQDETWRQYCDCPGFGDSRGSEVNIANAVNIKKALNESPATKVILLISYHELKAARGAALFAAQHMLIQLFGGSENLERYEKSVLVCVTQAPKNMGIQQFREMFLKSGGDPESIVAKNMFLYDPLNRGDEESGFWSRSRILVELSKLRRISKSEAKTLFQTVLNDNDHKQLKLITREQASAIGLELDKKDFEEAKKIWDSLTPLNVVGNDEVEKLLEEVVGRTISHRVTKYIQNFKKKLDANQVDEARCSLDDIKQISTFFPKTVIDCQTDNLDLMMKLADDKYEVQQKIHSLMAENESIKAQNKNISEELNKMKNEFEKKITKLEMQQQQSNRCTIM